MAFLPLHHREGLAGGPRASPTDASRPPAALRGWPGKAPCQEAIILCGTLFLQTEQDKQAQEGGPWLDQDLSGSAQDVREG